MLRFVFDTDESAPFTCDTCRIQEPGMQTMEGEFIHPEGWYTLVQAFTPDIPNRPVGYWFYCSAECLVSGHSHEHYA